MAAITASGDISLTLNETVIKGKQREVRVTILLGTNGNDYPPNGIPLPESSSFGMVRSMDYLNIYDSASTGPVHLMWKYDASNNSIRGYTTSENTSTATGVLGHRELSTGVAVTTKQWEGIAVGW
jgi:hypothetical protein